MSLLGKGNVQIVDGTLVTQKSVASTEGGCAALKVTCVGTLFRVCPVVIFQFDVLTKHLTTSVPSAGVLLGRHRHSSVTHPGTAAAVTRRHSGKVAQWLSRIGVVLL